MFSLARMTLTYLSRSFHLCLFALALLAWPVLSLTMLGHELCLRLVPRRRSARPGPQRTGSASRRRSASILILNWNGRDLLAEGLPSVVRAVERDGGDHEIIVVDNGSTDGSVEYVRSQFPQVKVCSLGENRYFGGGNNAGVASATRDTLVFLNNDMVVAEDFLRPLLDGFSDDSIFAVTSQIFLHDPTRRRVESGKTRGTWRRGALELSHALPSESDARNGHGPAFWAGGGSSAVDRAKFEAIGGFDPLFNPFYFEDTDLSYQAWKRGWKILFCPASQVVHKHRASTGRLDPRVVNRIFWRNYLLFIWKNITDLRMMLAHLLLLPATLTRLGGELGPGESARVLFMALTCLPQALRRRTHERAHHARSDHFVFQVANCPFAYQQEFHPPAPFHPGSRLRILYVCPYVPSPQHGGGIYMLNMIRNLSRQHDVTLLALTDSPEEDSYLSELERLCRRVVVLERHPLLVSSDPFGILPTQLTQDFGDRAIGDTIRQVLVDDHYDVIDCQYIQIAHHIPRLRNRAIVLTEHEVQHAATRRRLGHETNAWKKVALFFQWVRWVRAETRLCQRFNQVVTLTGEDADALRLYNPHLPIAINPARVDPVYYRPLDLPEEPDSLLYLGNFRHPPNVDAALFLADEILPEVQQRVPGIKLRIAGPWPTAVIEQLSQRGNIHVTGWLDDIRPLWARSSLFVASIRLGMGMRLKMLEALAMGKAVVATRLACAGLDVQHGKDVWIAETASEFAEGIATLLQDEQLRRSMGRAGRRLVEERYCWENAAQEQIRLYLANLAADAQSVRRAA